ncbi:MAG: hypothetical protein RI885_2685 [Actinomycetota bacterium]
MLAVGLSTAIGVALSGITAPGGRAPGVSAYASASASASPSGELAASTLVPVYPEPFTVEAVSAETIRVADLMVGFVDASEGGASTVLNDDVFEQVVPAEGEAASYFGVLHTLTLEPSIDSAAQAESLQSALEAGGWIVRTVSDTGAAYSAVLSSSPDPEKSWFLQIGADLSVPGQSVVALQLASPSLP